MIQLTLEEKLEKYGSVSFKNIVLEKDVCKKLFW